MGVIYIVRYGLFYWRRKSFGFFDDMNRFTATLRRYKLYEDRGRGEQFKFKGGGKKYYMVTYMTYRQKQMEERIREQGEWHKVGELRERMKKIDDLNNKIKSCKEDGEKEKA